MMTPPSDLLARRLYEQVQGFGLTDLLLQAACRLPTAFTAEDLTVAAWQLCRDAGREPNPFALKGHADHPDHHKAYALLCGTRGLTSFDYLARNGKGGLYSLTAHGHKRAKVALEERIGSPAKWRRQTMDTLEAQQEASRVYGEQPTPEELNLYRNSQKREACRRWMKRQESFARAVSWGDAVRAFDAVVLGAEKTEGAE